MLKDYLKEIILIILIFLIFVLVSNYLKIFLNPNEIFKIYFSFENIILNNKILFTTLFILIFILWVSLFLPLISIFQIFSGLIFGEYIGTFVSLFSILIGSLFIYTYPLEKITFNFLNSKKYNLSFISNNFKKNELLNLILVRVLPGFPFSLQGALASYLKVNILKYILSIIIGLAPISYLLNLIGSGISKSLIENDSILFFLQKDIRFLIPFVIVIILYVIKFSFSKYFKKFYS